MSDRGGWGEWSEPPRPLAAATVPKGWGGWSAPPPELEPGWRSEPARWVTRYPPSYRPIVTLRLVCAGVLALVLMTLVVGRGEETTARLLVEGARSGEVTEASVDDEDVWRWYQDGAVRRADGLAVSVALANEERNPSSDTPSGRRGGGLPESSTDVLQERLQAVAGRSIDVHEQHGILPDWLDYTHMVVGLALFWLLVAGPAPWLGNRWAWLWMSYPFDVPIGALLFALLSGPLPKVSRPLWERRLNGSQGFGVAVAGLVIAMVGAAAYQGIQMIVV